MTVVGRIRAGRLAKGIAGRGQLYARAIDSAQRLALQLEAWNAQWKLLLDHIPYYQRLQQEFRLPATFSSWQEFTERMPVTTRDKVQKHKAEMFNSERPSQWSRQTGGSTAQPIQLPAWNSENDFTTPDMWLGRSWYGIKPESRLFMLWGHSHLLGSGLRGKINAWKRNWRDRLLGYYRFSAYDLQPAALRRAARKLVWFRPDYLIGYSVALDLFARANADYREQLRGVGLKAVVGAAEAFPATDSRQRLEGLFGCPVAMEYGSVETGLIAHTCPKGGYRVFWGTYFVEAADTPTPSRVRKIFVTSLFPRCFPLVRYEIGDEIELWDEREATSIGLESFKRIVGRCNDYVILSDATVVHSEAFTHAVRPCGEISGYQVVQSGSDIEILVTSPASLSPESRMQIRHRLAKVHPALAGVEVKQVDRLEQTIAGKTRMVIRR